MPPDASTTEKSVISSVEDHLRRGDVVVSTHPERLTVLDYYLPRGLTYVTSLGPVSDARYMDWRDVLGRLEAARASKTLGPALDNLDRGKDILLVRPVTENSSSWKAEWTALVRKRSRRSTRGCCARIRASSAERWRPTVPTPRANGVRATLYTKVHD